MDNTRIFRMAFATVYPHYITKAEGKGLYEGGGACHHPLADGLR